ncbi:hypothetical protein CPU12_12600 [Malaciobacter molluscorum LMG 25693]|uniref:Cache sensor-containing signal transduction protein n=1 Tax=Malaciobacter molluscorum LMG 25693 TaxID=870501 RepID=A0A2G1DEY4_9BACT|nr:cache domain-containing protein [Malaciobacter molluscorum]AXX92794.1 Cache sensor-containing signal transduction protein [Malaciobacter molluscorum LMG 25693]PHO17014.1 hypothetical protein CPU12_12600 [Malaciobacter molluscorum LMG 25693]
MSKTNKYLFIITIITIFSICLLFYVLSILNSSDKQLNILENALTTTKNLIDEQKRYALSLSILLSEDKELINSFINKNRKQSFDIINTKIKTLKNFQNSNFQVQIHNKDLSTYLRNWDFNIKNIKLASFREGLVKVKDSKKPLVSIELGKRLNIKAISPIIHNNKFIGSIETIIDFKYISQYLEKKDFKLFILLDKKYLNIATNLKNNDKIDNYILVNDANINDLKDLQLSNMKGYGYMSNEKYSFVYFSYYDLNNKLLGYILTSIENENHINLNNSFEYNTINKNEKIQIK